MKCELSGDVGLPRSIRRPLLPTVPAQEGSHFRLEFAHHWTLHIPPDFYGS